MVVLATMPSASVALVVTRSATASIANGMAVAAGIVLGDLVFIMLAVLGLFVVAETLGGLFMIIKYLAAAYLIWFGFSLLSSKNETALAANTSGGNGNLATSLLAGFFLTLGDIKAVLFYASLFPVFIDLSALRIADILVIIFITITAVGGVKIFYALTAAKVASMAGSLGFGNIARKTAGGMMVGAGGYLIVKT